MAAKPIERFVKKQIQEQGKGWAPLSQRAKVITKCNACGRRMCGVVIKNARGVLRVRYSDHYCPPPATVGF